jgi:hypothetical protein
VFQARVFTFRVFTNDDKVDIVVTGLHTGNVLDERACGKQELRAFWPVDSNAQWDVKARRQYRERVVQTRDSATECVTISMGGSKSRKYPSRGGPSTMRIKPLQDLSRSKLSQQGHEKAVSMARSPCAVYSRLCSTHSL